MTNVSRYTLIGGVLSLALFGWGCNPFQAAQDKVNEKIGEKVTEGILGKVTGGNVDVKDGGKNVTFEDKKNGGVSSFGEDVSLPDGFPSNVILYPGAKNQGVTMGNKDGKTAWVMQETTDDVKKVTDWYAGETKGKGWTEASNMNFSGNALITWEKDKEKLGLSVTPQDGENVGKTTLIITWSEEKTAPSADTGSIDSGENGDE